MLLEMLIGGLIALKEYVALHVVTCLIPAFLLAGGIIAFTSRSPTSPIRYNSRQCRRSRRSPQPRGNGPG